MLGAKRINTALCASSATERVTAPYFEDPLLLVQRTIRSAELIDQAKRTETAAFETLWMSDHFDPWNDE